jgi:hypothetical protein
MTYAMIGRGCFLCWHPGELAVYVRLELPRPSGSGRGKPNKSKKRSKGLWVVPLGTTKRFCFLQGFQPLKVRKRIFLRPVK